MRAMQAFSSSTRHVVGVGLQALVIAAIIAALTFATAVAVGGNPAGAGSLKAARSQTSWIELSQVGAAATIQPTLGSSVSFSTGYPSTVKNPRIEVLCYQDGSLVYGEAGSVTYSFQLGGGGSIWLTNGGGADCTANLFYFGSHAGKQTYNKLASTSFSAGS
jgi:hypothetical protein